MLVYRVEHKKYHCGPYVTHRYLHSKKYLAMIETHNGDSEKWPGIYKDVFPSWGDDTDTSEFICGFYSLEDLFTWFKGFRKGLNERNYIIRVFNVGIKKIRFGQKQIAFKKTARPRKPVRELSLV